MGELCKKDSTLNENSVFTNAMNKNSQVKSLQQENTGISVLRGKRKAEVRRSRMDYSDGHRKHVTLSPVLQ